MKEPALIIADHKMTTFFEEIFDYGFAPKIRLTLKEAEDTFSTDEAKISKLSLP